MRRCRIAYSHPVGPRWYTRKELNVLVDLHHNFYMSYTVNFDLSSPSIRCNRWVLQFSHFPLLCRFNPTTPLTIIPRYNTFVKSKDSPNQKKPTAVTNVVPTALQTAYATDTSILARLILKPTILITKQVRNALNGMAVTTF